MAGVPSGKSDGLDRAGAYQRYLRTVLTDASAQPNRLSRSGEPPPAALCDTERNACLCATISISMTVHQSLSSIGPDLPPRPRR